MEVLSNHLLSKKTVYPEKILQFGTGVLLRGLIDYFVHLANEKGIFQGNVLVVKSTPGTVEVFERQGHLFTHLLTGIRHGKLVEESLINTSISRVLSANQHWAMILQSAHQAELEIVISNTTEVGLQYLEEDLFRAIPESFPAKLTAWLYERFRHFEGDSDKGAIIIPTELLVNNGDLLKEIVLKHASFNQLEIAFETWLLESCHFCNSLVDRIVPGTPEKAKLEALWEKRAYQDELLITSELYALWAVQANEKVRRILSFSQAHPGMILDENIEDYRERKLRILNGTHTLTVCLAYLAGLDTVYEAMQSEQISRFAEELALAEICPTVPVKDSGTTKPFALEVLDRFRNPSLQHFLLDITLQCTTKMRMRNVPNIRRYFEKFQKVPRRMAQGIAAYLLFQKAVRVENNRYFGQRGSEFYPIRDDFAPYFYEKWQNLTSFDSESLQTWVLDILGNSRIWGEDLSRFEGFGQSIANYLHQFIHQGFEEIP